MTPSELHQAQADYLSSGGQITHIPIGVSGEEGSPNTFNNMVVSAQGKVSIKELRIAHNRRVAARLRENDAVAIALIAEHLPAANTARSLCKSCSMSPDKLDRLLRSYFADDPHAAQFFRVTRDEREKQIKEQYPELRRTMSQAECAKVLHVRHSELKRIVALYGMDNIKVQVGNEH
jgi:hypothetical protein